MFSCAKNWLKKYSDGGGVKKWYNSKYFHEKYAVTHVKPCDGKQYLPKTSSFITLLESRI